MNQKKAKNDRKDLVLRMKRIEGQVRALVGMLEHDAYCIEVLTQLAAARAALLAAGKLILAEHMNSCVVESFKKGQSQHAVNEINTILGKFIG